MEEDIETPRSHFAELRTRARRDMAAIGITDSFIPLLVDTFYGRVRTHAQLGPVFEARLAGRWPEHMEKMKRFWSAGVPVHVTG